MKYFVHEEYGRPTIHSHDIALLKLTDEVDLTVHTPACLPESGQDFTGKIGSVYGKNLYHQFSDYSINKIVSKDIF